MNEIKFTTKEDIIWDTGTGYEIGYFLGESDFTDEYLANIVSGTFDVSIYIPIKQTYKYKDELINELTEKYGYEKRFSKDF